MRRPVPMPDVATACVHPWDLIGDEVGRRVLAALPSFRESALRDRLRRLAVTMMMDASVRRRERALGRLGELLTSGHARYATDLELMLLLASGAPPDHLPVSLH